MTEKSIVEVSMNRQGVIGRRGFLRGVGLGAAGMAGLSFTDLMAVHADDLRKRDMAVILLWMSGGPSQMETFDPKPGTETGGEVKVIDTAVPGIKVAAGWEKTAEMMGEIALIRSMTSKEGNHQRATYQMHTGYAPSGSVKHPGFGSVVASELGNPKFDLPHIVSIGGGTVGSGLLGVQYEPFNVANPEKPPTNVELPVPAGRFTRRLGLLGQLEEAGFAVEKAGGADRVKDHRDLYRQTAGMILSPRMKAFDVSQEDSQTRARYGETPFGQGALLARRLVETGVTFVEVRMNGWDSHQTLDLGKQTGPVNPAFAALISDLKAGGRLDRTLIVWMGEFGRTPKISPRGGRDHFPRVFNVALAGGGVKGGQVIGASSADGTEVKDHPVTINDLMTSFCHTLKIDPAKENMSPAGRPIKIVDGGKVIKPLFG